MSATPLRETTYDVRVWKTEKYVGKSVTTYTVRWSVAGRRGKSRTGRRRWPRASDRARDGHP